VTHIETILRSRRAARGLLTTLAAAAFIGAPVAAAAADASCGRVSANTCALAARIQPGLNIDSPLNMQGTPTSRITPAQVSDICQRFHAVRLPFKFVDEDGHAIPGAITTAKSLADSFAACGAVVIVDNHVFKGFEREANQGDPNAQASFHQLWTELGQAFKDDSPNIILELLNEPSEKIKAARWNEALADAVKAIRATGNRKTILIGPVNYNGVWALGGLQLPQDDSIIVGVHVYEPMKFTHQGANWGSNNLPAGVTFTPDQQQSFSKWLDRARQWSDQQGVPVVIGEFGVFKKAPPDARLSYVQSFVRAANQDHLPFLYWEYDKGFGLYDPKTGSWDSQMLAAVTGGLSK
jgi:endoglucanase